MANAAVALTNSLSTNTRIAGAIKTLSDARSRQQRVLSNTSEPVTVLHHDARAQIDEVFLVLALLGEALLPLNIFDNNFYPETLDEVQAAILSSGHELMPTAFDELAAELQYVCTAGLTFCSCFAPIPVYRGFGAAVLNDWEWGCPDIETLMKKLIEKTGVWLKLQKQREPQANRAVLQGFDQVIQMLQVKRTSFFSVRPSISSFAAQQPHFLPLKEKEVHDEISVLEDWTKKVEKLGHPAPRGEQVSTWAIPFASWSSPYSCQLMKSRHDWKTIMTNQMDPGRILHAFVCRHNLNLNDRQLLILPNGSPAESLACWLEGLPGMTHKVLQWSDFDTEQFEKKCGKSLKKQLGHHPLPEKFAMRNPSLAHRPSLPSALSSPRVEQASLPPPYSPDHSSRYTVSAKVAEKPVEPAPHMNELPTERAPAEIDSSETKSAAHAAAAPARQIHHAASMSAVLAGRKAFTTASEGVSTVRSLTEVRRKPPPTVRHPSIILPGSRSLEPQSELAKPTIPPKEPLAHTQSSPDLGSQPPKPPIPDVVLSMPDGPEGSQVLLAAKDRSKNDVDSGRVEPVELPSEPVVHEIDSVESPRNLGSQTTAEPAMSDSRAQKTNYLELLNKVASGEISPQTLQQMLQAQTVESGQASDATGPSSHQTSVADSTEKSEATKPTGSTTEDSEVEQTNVTAATST